MRVSNDYLQAVLDDGSWELIKRDGSVATVSKLRICGKNCLCGMGLY